MGDLQALADSIAKQGLLQPIGITENKVLVFGERRLLACRDVLGLREIEARTVNVTSIVEGERDENEVRKDFTSSERVAIGRAIESQIGNRHPKWTFGRCIEELVKESTSKERAGAPAPASTNSQAAA